MALFDGVTLTAKEKSENGLKLPEELSIFEIWELWKGNQESLRIYLKALVKAFENGRLKGVRVESYPYPDPMTQFSFLGPFTSEYKSFTILISKNDFLAWLESENEPKPTGCLLAQWWSYSQPTQQNKTQKTEKNKEADNLNSERECQLHKLIWRVYQYLNEVNKPKTAQAVWGEIRYRYHKHDEEKIIQEVTHDEILWISAYGNESKLKRASFDKTLSNLKKNPPL